MTPIVGRIQNTALVREHDPGHQRRLLLLLWIVLAVAGPAVFYVWLQTRFVGTQYDLQRLRDRLDEAQERRLVLDAQLQEMSSPARVRDRVSALDLDLVVPAPDSTQVVRILHEPSGEDTLRADAAPRATGEEARQ